MDARVADTSAAAAEPDRAKVFVSYSRKDVAFAEVLVRALAARGYDAFLDLVDIAPGEPWQARLAGLIAAADSVVFVISPDSAASEICGWELEESERLGKRLIPVVHRPIDIARAPPTLARLNWVFAAAPSDFETAVDKLAGTLHTDIAWVREHTRIGERASRWDAQGRGAAETLRGPALEAAERWLALQPKSANAPTELHRAYIAASRRAVTRRQRVAVAGSLIVALVAVALAVVAEIARRDAQVQRKRAERSLTLATGTANGLVFDLAQKFRHFGVPVATINDILERAGKLQDELMGGGESNPALRMSRAEALMETAETSQILGDSRGARRAAGTAGAIFRSLLAAEPDNTAYARELSVGDTKVGDALLAEGDMTGALAVFRASCARMEPLVRQDAGNATWQRDLALCRERIGIVLRAQGRMDDALAAFRNSLAIRKALASRPDPDVQLLRDISISYAAIGDILAARGHLDDAAAAHADALTIRQIMVEHAPRDTRRQRDLAAAYEKIGDIRQRQDRLDEALAAYRTELDILRKLVATDQDNTTWRADVMSCVNRIGDILKKHGKLADALAAFKEGLAAAKALTAKDRDNAGWQRDLSIAENKIAEVLKAQDRLDEALASYREALAIRRALAGKDPGNVQWQGDVAWSQGAIGEVRSKQGHRDEALAAWREALAIRRALVAKDAGNVPWQLDLVLCLARIARTGDDPPANFAEALAILGRLDTAGLLPRGKKRWIGVIEADRDEAARAHGAK